MYREAEPTIDVPWNVWNMTVKGDYTSRREDSPENEVGKGKTGSLYHLGRGKKASERRLQES